MDMIEWFVGADWGSEAHQVCIIDGEGSVRGERSFVNRLSILTPDRRAKLTP